MRQTLYVGLDVHKASISVAMAEGGQDGVVRFVGAIPNTPTDIAKLATRLATPGGQLGQWLGWYESGEPAGFLMAVRGAIFLLMAYRATFQHSPTPPGLISLRQRASGSPRVRSADAGSLATSSLSVSSGADERGWSGVRDDLKVDNQALTAQVVRPADKHGS